MFKEFHRRVTETFSVVYGKARKYFFARFPKGKDESVLVSQIKNVSDEVTIDSLVKRNMHTQCKIIRYSQPTVADVSLSVLQLKMLQVG